MGSRNKNKKKGKSRRSDLFQQALREFEKRDFKQALKDAKVCYRQDPSHEHRAFLERAFCARARELEQLGMPQEARHVVDGLLELGVTESSVREQLAGMSVTLGIQSKKAVPGMDDLSPEARARLLNEMVDRAVVKRIPGDSVTAELRPGLRAVREAFDALERGDEAQAIELLKEVPRNSPFADWKLFVRGLAAYFRCHRDEMAANWDRLAEGRAGSQIAAKLRSLADAAEAGPRSPLPPGIGRLERPLLGTSVLHRLAEFQEALAADNVDDAVRVLREGRPDFKKLDAPLRNRLAEVLSSWAIRRGDGDFLDAMKRFLNPPDIDPRWNRAEALLNQHPDYDDFEESEASWLKYVRDDLPLVTAFSDDERPIVESLVWRQLGRLSVREADLENEPEFLPPNAGKDDQLEPTPYAAELRSRAVDYYHKSLKRNPRQAETYRELACAQENWGQEEQAAETLDRLLKQFPDDAESLVSVGLYDLYHGDPLRGREYIVRAHHLQPLDDNVARQLWAAHLEAARHFAKLGNWDEGRAAFEAAAAMDPRNERLMQRLARQAVFEHKAKQTGRAEELEREARAASPEPTPALLLMAAEAALYGLPRAVRDKFQTEFDKAVKKRCTSSTAGRLSEVLAGYLQHHVAYVGRAKHLKAVLDYLKRSSRVKFQQQDLRIVCDFLNTNGKQELFQKLVTKGRKQFSENPYFHFQTGRLEMDKGPLRCNRRLAADCFERVVELTENSDDPEAKEWAEEAKGYLTFLREVGFSPPEFPAPRASGPGQFRDELADMIDRMAAEMGIDLDDLIDEELINNVKRSRRGKR